MQGINALGDWGNEAAKSNLLAYAEKEDLDNKAADYDVARLLITPANPDAVPPVEAVWESDDRLGFPYRGKWLDSTSRSVQRITAAALAAQANAYTAVKAYWHNLDAAEKGEVIVDANTKFERRKTFTKRGLLSKRSRLTATQQKATEPSAANYNVLRHIYATEATALQASKAAWEKIQRGVAEFSITLDHGRPEIVPELPAKVSGFKPAIDGCAWLISKATHCIADSGFTTALELEMKLENLPS